MKRLLLSAVVLGLLAIPATAQTNKALDIVPDEALGFVLIKDLRQLHDKAEALAGKVNAKDHFAFLEGLLSADLKKGLNDKGSVVVIAMSGKDEKKIPCPILALPVGDAAILLQSLGAKDESKEGISMGSIDMPLLTRFWFEPKEKSKEPIGPKMPVVVAKKDGFVLVTAVDSREQLQSVLASKKSIANMVEPAKAWLDEQDICGAATPAGTKVPFPLMWMNEGQPFIKDVDKNVKLAAFGARIEKDGNTRLLARVYFTDGSPYGKRTGTAEPVQTTLLSSLPDERYVFAALARVSPEANFENLIAGHHHQKLPEAKAKELTDASTQLLRRVKEVGMSVNAEPREKKSGSQNTDATTVILVKVDDATAFVDNASDLIKKHTEATNGVSDTHSDVKIEPMSVMDKKSVLITVTEKKKDAKSDKEQDQRPADVLIMTVMDPKTVLVGNLKKTDQAEMFVKEHSMKPAKSLESDGELKKTFSLLPKQTHLAAFINLKNILEAEGLRHCPPLGFGMSVLPGSIEAQFVLPFDTLQALVAAENARGKKEPNKEK